MEACMGHDPKTEEELKHSFFPRVPTQRELSLQIWDKEKAPVL